MSELRGRALIESRFGKLGAGQKSVVIGEEEYDLPALLVRMDFKFEDSWLIDVQALSESRFCIRYYDGQDQRIVAHEFDDHFAFIAETRGHVAEWIGEDAYYEWFRSMAPRLQIPGTDI